MIDIIIRTVVKFLYGLNAKHWKFAIDLIRQLADKKDMNNSQRADTFFAYFKTYFPDFENRAIEKGRDLAVDFARKKGWINT